MALPIVFEGRTGAQIAGDLNAAMGALGAEVAGIDFLSVFAEKATKGIARVNLMGTSIAAASHGTLAKMEEALRIKHGDPCANSFQMGGLGGSFTSASSGWVKQPYGGPMFIRARGDSASTAVNQNVYGDRLVVRYSKETNGGSFGVLVDGVSVGSIDCSGPQSYNNKATFTLSAGNHVITFSPPASGFAYLEAYETFDSAKTGVLIRDYTRGGTALKNAVFLAAHESPQVAGIAISGNAGLLGQFDPECDLAIIQWTVNDSASVDGWVTGGGYAAALTALIQMHSNASIPVILIIEMAGHYSLPVPSGKNTNFNLIRQTALSLAGPLVKVIDWHSKTIHPDRLHYAGKYYAATGVNLVDGSYTGDFVHPAPEKGGYTVLDALLSDLLDVQIRRYSTILKEAARRINYFVSDDAALATLSLNGASADATAGANTYWSFCSGPSALSTGKTVPLYVKSDMVNQRPALNTTIAASETEDAFGKYIVASTTALAMGTVGVGSTLWLTFLMSGNCNVRATAVAARAVDDYGAVAPLDGSNRWNHFSALNVAGDRPVYVSVKLAVTASNASLSISTTGGRLYGVWCNTGDAPVVPAVLA